MSVIALKCKSYSKEEVRLSLEDMFNKLGGIEKYIDIGETVLLKVNLVMEKSPDKHATTHPVIAEELAKLLIKYGAKVIIGDVPGGPYTKSRINKIYVVSGMKDAAENSGASLNYTPGTHSVNMNGLLLKRLDYNDIIRVDKIVNVCKCKTHQMMSYTGAVKNLYGCLPSNLKAAFHFSHSNYDDFANILIDICESVKPVLHVMDAVIGMQGNGPTSGTPKEVGLILCSSNPYDLDRVAIKVMNYKDSEVPTVYNSIKRNLATEKYEDINIIGVNIEDYVIPDYERILDTRFKNMPRFLNKIVSRLMRKRPKFIKSKCVKCGVCKDACPAKIINIDNSKKVPYYKHDKCIRCFCCQELCPYEAIEIHYPIFSKK